MYECLELKKLLQNKQKKTLLSAFLTPFAKNPGMWPNCINKQNKDLFFTAKGFVAIFLFISVQDIHTSISSVTYYIYIICVKNWWCQLQFEEVGSWFCCLDWPFVIIFKVKVIFSIIILQKVHQNWHNYCCCYVICRRLFQIQSKFNS